jgi:hypothetical protein
LLSPKKKLKEKIRRRAKGRKNVDKVKKQEYDLIGPRMRIRFDRAQGSTLNAL